MTAATVTYIRHRSQIIAASLREKWGETWGERIYRSNFKCQINRIDRFTGGRGGIRTHGTVSRTPVFKTGSLNHSDTLPVAWLYRPHAPSVNRIAAFYFCPCHGEQINAVAVLETMKERINDNRRAVNSHRAPNAIKLGTSKPSYRYPYPG